MGLSCIHLNVSVVMLVAVIGVLPAIASGRDPIPTPPGFRIGIELELQPSKLAHLTGYFDFQRLASLESIRDKLSLADGTSTQVTGRDLTISFLQDNPTALQSLPEVVRNHLTEGLQLQSNLIVRKTEILDASGKAPLEKRPTLILGDSPPVNSQRPALILPGNSRPAPPVDAVPQDLAIDERLFQKASNGLTITHNAVLNIVNQRWAAIHPKKRLELVLPLLEKLGPLQKAFLAAQVGREMHLREDLPEDARQLFRNFSWKRDGTTMEFIHQETDPALFVHDPETFLKQASLLAKRAGVERQVFDPESVRSAAERAGTEAPKWGSLHYHVSREGQNLRQLAGELNRLLVVRRINLGIVNDIKGTGSYIYTPDLEKRGLLQLHGDDRIEFRAHHLPLEEELREISGLLAMDPVAATGKVRTEIRSILTAQTLDRILRNNPAFIENLLTYLTPAEKHLSINALWAAVTAGEPYQRARTYRALQAMGALDEPLRRTFLRDGGLFKDSRSLEIFNSNWFQEVVETLPSGQKANLHRTLVRLLDDENGKSEIAAKLLLGARQALHPRAAADLRRFISGNLNLGDHLPLTAENFYQLASRHGPLDLAFYRKLAETVTEGHTIPPDVVKRLQLAPGHASIAVDPRLMEHYVKLMHSGATGVGLLPKFVFKLFQANPALQLEAARVRFKRDPAANWGTRSETMQGLAKVVLGDVPFESGIALSFLKELGRPDEKVLRLLEEGLTWRETRVPNLLNARDYLFSLGRRDAASESQFAALILRGLQEWRKPGAFEVHAPIVQAAFGKALENKLASPAIFAEIQAIVDSGVPGGNESLRKLRAAVAGASPPAAACARAFRQIDHAVAGR